MWFVGVWYEVGFINEDGECFVCVGVSWEWSGDEGCMFFVEGEVNFGCVVDV